MCDSGVVIGRLGPCVAQACLAVPAAFGVQRFEIAHSVVETKASKGSEMVEISEKSKYIMAFWLGRTMFSKGAFAFSSGFFLCICN